MSPLRQMSGLLVLLALVSMDQSVVSLALPSIMHHLGAHHAYSWLTTAYLWGTTVVLPLGGHLCDLYGCRRIVLWGLGLFSLGSVLCGFAPSLGWLVAFRVLQGLGGGLGTAATLTLVALMFSPRERGVAVGYQSAAIGVASILGPPAGGLVTQYAAWPWVFWLQLPFCLLSLWLILVSLPRYYVAREHPAPFDAAGATWLSFCSVSLLVALSGAAIALLPALLFGLLFWRSARRTEFPVLHFELLRDRTVLGCVLSRGLLGGAYLATLLYLPLYLQKVRHLQAATTGWMFVAMTFSLVMGARVVARLTRQSARYRFLLLSGAGVACLALALLAASVLGGWGPGWQALLVALLGLGAGLQLPTHRIAVQNAVPAALQGSAAGLLEFTKQMFTAALVAWLGVLLAGGRDWRAEQLAVAGLGVGMLLAAFLIEDRQLGSQTMAGVKRSERVLLRR